MKYNIYIIAFATIIVFASCNKNKSELHEEETEHHDEHENDNTAVLSPEQMESIEIVLGSIEKKQLTASVKANGILKVPNQNKANATASLGGTIKSIQVQTGNIVSQGQIIATISNNAFVTLQEEFLSVSSKSELAQIEYVRQMELQKENASALKNLQSAEAELKILNAQKSSLKKQLELIGINSATLTSDNILSVVNITSPINGVISNIMVNIGSYVDANNSIAEIVDNSQLHLDLYVYEKDLQKLKVGQTIHFTLTNNPGQEYDAEVYAISNTFEPSTKAVAVHAMVKGNKLGLMDGMSITALISLEDATVDAVPINAIVNHEGQNYIFIVTDRHSEEEHHTEIETAEHEHDEHGHEHTEEDESVHTEKGTTFEKIPVRKGTTDIGYAEIHLLKEIPADSKVVVNGAFFILAKMNNKGEAHAH
ncbi:MAG TPA: efflux RND transporter periplasmic adaptor subunit [Chitinophagales bacterium]|nr:efflux RND transporter periplasmic adaptor subunit [Chitinophagales bacterium]HRG85959.1 efflux RND transporter periplasmic adaptor subunit [Chitinophagales bacterium]HRH52502.1 efflux RND transporter periplasmic adaptor subunit [Chitinophagales bacterium]